jgi:hypothetical protein
VAGSARNGDVGCSVRGRRKPPGAPPVPGRLAHSGPAHDGLAGANGTAVDGLAGNGRSELRVGIRAVEAAVVPDREPDASAVAAWPPCRDEAELRDAPRVARPDCGAAAAAKAFQASASPAKQASQTSPIRQARECWVVEQSSPREQPERNRRRGRHGRRGRSRRYGLSRSRQDLTGTRRRNGTGRNRTSAQRGMQRSHATCGQGRPQGRRLAAKRFFNDGNGGLLGSGWDG